MVHILNDIIYESPKENHTETYYEQLGMFDALGLQSNLSDILIWEAEYETQTIRIYDNTGSVVTSFPISELEMRVSPESIKKIRTYADGFDAGLRQVIDVSIDVNISGAWASYHVKGLMDRSRGMMFASGVAFDINAVYRQRRRLEYLETHDPLTDLMNLNSFEAQFDALTRFGMYPLSLVVFRIDNLSDACGTMGYQAGNTMIRNVAEVIRECFFDADMIGRTGGGEYCCAFTGKTQLEIETHIDEATMRLHGSYLNLIKTEISCGYAIAECEMDFSRLYHEAYQKLIRRRNMQKHLAGTSVLDSINAIISRKMGWGKRAVRLQSMSTQIGKALFCTEEMLADIKLLAKIADIGLIGIDDNLLVNRRKLSEEDQEIYCRYFEVGREIISSIESLSQMEGLYADLFKRYDEWQDAIAIPSRIVAVARGFDDLMMAGGRMTYRELGQKMAAAKGTLYCPEMVDVLMEIARKYHTWPAHSQKN